MLLFKALNLNSTRFKHFIAKTVDMRVHPLVAFHLDTAFDYAGDIAMIMNTDRVKADLKADTNVDVENSVEDEA